MERERDGQAYSSSPPATSAFGPLCEDVAELGVVLVLVHVMYADVSVSPSATISSHGLGGKKRTYLCRLSGLGYLCSRSGQNGHT